MARIGLQTSWPPVGTGLAATVVLGVLWGVDLQAPSAVRAAPPKAPAKAPAPAVTISPRTVSGELLNYQITRVETRSEGDGGGDGLQPAAETSYVDLLVTEGGVRRERLHVEPGVRFRTHAVEEGRIVSIAEEELPDLQSYGSAFRSPVVRATLSPRGWVQQLESFLWIWKGRLVSLEADAVVIRGRIESPARELCADWSEWDPESYATAASQVIRIPLSGNVTCTVNLDPVSSARMKLEKGSVVHILPDASRRARYVDAFKINATTSFSGGDYDLLNLAEPTADGLKLKKDAQGRWGFAVTIENGATDAQKKTLWSRPDVRVYDRSGLRVPFDGRVPENGAAGLWYDPRTSQITHIFW